MPIPPHIVIIGAGPSGLMAAEVLASAGCCVSVYDHMPSVARKFLMAGRGGLNLTHSEPLDTFLTRYGTAYDWLEPSIRAFDPEALRAWCHGLGIETFIGTSGRVFPIQMKAAPLLRAWLKRLETFGVQFHVRHRWRGWESDTKALVFENASGERVHVTPDATLLAMGGASWPRLGSDGGWARLLEEKGVAIAPFQPANCGFSVAWSEVIKNRFSGTPLKNISLTHAGVLRRGEAMLTRDGLEGGAVYALSALLRESVNRTGNALIHIDLFPDVSQATLMRKLAAPRGSKSLSTFLKRAGFSPIAINLMREVLSSEKLKDANTALLCATAKALPLPLTGTFGMARAISSAGGIMRSSVDANFQLKALHRVFVCGEMLNWEAPTGGYLLQGCLSTAVAAANGVLRSFGLEGG
jgi:uncharacterized flavoprotein (TIGR03862 family)